MSINRRELLVGALGLIPGCSKSGRGLTLSGDNSADGHRLRTGEFPAPEPAGRQKVLILGGGVAGCTAAYTLENKGFRDYHILELGNEAGGNARSGRNSVSAYPLGAHYLPLPHPEEKDLLNFLEDAGALTGWSARGEPRFHEEYLCHDPEDRVFYEGRWFEGLIAWKALAPHELKDLKAFFQFVTDLRHKKGRDGRRLFAIPLDQSSRDPEWTALDRMSFADFIKGQGWHAPYLAWYLDYCCRDDYGTGWQAVSAWAGLHYFAARDAEKSEGATILTWPEGNAWLIRQLMRRSQDRLTSGTLIFRVEKTRDGFAVDGWQSRTGRALRWHAEALIVTLPRFVAQRLLPAYAAPSGAMSYAPWMVANCTVDRLPESEGSALAWDNVPFGSASLGYVVATHQTLTRYEGPSVLSSYWPLASGDPALARMIAGLRQLPDWERLVLSDLEHMHPGISEQVKVMDFWLWGHAMIQPRPGYIWGAERARLEAQTAPDLAFAHSDMSGISIFEEAFARGRAAALHILQGRSVSS